MSNDGNRAEKCGIRCIKFILQWHITHRCNLRCKHCYQDEFKEEMSSTLIDETFDKYIRFIGSNGYSGHVYLTGGEPLVHPDFFRLVEKIKKRGLPLTVLTNGTLVDRDAANRMKWIGVDVVQVSLDGTKEIHDGIRGNGAFERALDGIDCLVSQKIHVIVSFTAQKTNIKSFKSLAEVCKEHGVKKLWWDRVVIESSGGNDGLSLSTSEFKKMSSLAGKLREKYMRPDGSSLVSCERSLQFLGCADGCRKYTCHAGKDMLIITADGSVMPCRRLPFVIGNIKDGEIADIFASSSLMKELRDSSAPEECAGCSHAGFCKGGAKCVTYAQTGKLFARDVNCCFKIKSRP
ncbi:MAG: radical SAM protein [Clostridia bacterium]|nr:radical SAM protein [Clostridia bacterium]